MRKLMKIIKKFAIGVILLWLSACALVIVIDFIDGKIHPSVKSGVTNITPKKSQK